MNLDAQTHINTFSGGMYRDVNVIHQPDGTYRYAKNFQVVSHDGNNVSLKDSLGNRVVFTLPAPYNAIVANTQTEPTAIGMLSFPDTIVVFSTNYNGATGTAYGEIGYLKYLPFGESIEGTTTTVGGYNYGGYVPLYHHLSLNFHKGYEINNEGFCYAENEYVKRVYWTDNLNEPRVFNIADPIFTTYIASGSLSAVAGTQYMVLGGAITYNGTNYGPGLTAGNVFSTSGGIQIYAQAAGTPLVIEYYPYQLLSWTPSRTLGRINFQEYGTGTVNCGGKMYFYRLGLNTGYFTSWSYGCPPIHVGMSNTVVTGVAYHDFVGNGGLNITPINSGKSVKVKIDNIDTNFDIIQMACCEYDSTFEVPTLISIVQQSAINSTTLNSDGSITLEHQGGVNLGTLTTNDITLFPASILTCKTMCTNKNYNLIGNLTERQEFPSFDVSGVTIASLDYPLIATGDPRIATNDFIYDMSVATFMSPDVTANPAANAIRPFSRWLVTMGDNGANTVTYNAVQYVTGDVIVGVTGVATITFAGTGAARPCTTRQKYVPINYTGSIQRNNAIQFLDQDLAFWNYKNPAVASHNKGYWSNEKYRFGILFYDKKGNPFYVRHLGDYTMPDINTKGGLMRADVYPYGGGIAGYSSWSLNPSGVTIGGINIPQEIVDQCSGFSIVRAERDPRIVMQGLMYQCVADTTTSPGITIIRPMSTMFLSGDAYADTAQGCYSYIIPDLNVASAGSFYIRGLTNLGAAGTNLEQAAWLSPYPYTGAGTDYLITSTDYTVHGKLFSNANDGLAKRTATVYYWSSIDEAGYITGFLANQDFANNGILVNAAAGNIVDNITWGGGQPEINGRMATGCKKVFVSLNSDFFGYNTGVTYYSQIGAGQGEKILMNYLRDNSNPYGGSGDVALANTLYISTGHFQEFSSTVLAETLNGTFASGDYQGQNKYTFNGIHVFGGDCYTNMVDDGYALYNDTINAGVTYSLGLYFPCENNSNYDLRRGNKISNRGMRGTGAPYASGIQYSGAGTTILESYSYNEGYSSEGDLFQFPALPVNFLNAGRFPERIRFAGEKFIGEILDSFRTFLTNDYKDVNVVYGEINNLRPKGDYVYYWQNNAIGASPIKQRQLISGANGSETVLGTGGVIDYYQTISTVLGNQHRHGLTETKDGWIWFDMCNKSVCVLNYNGGANDITVPLGLKSWFNEIFVQVSNASIITIGLIDDPTFGVQMDQPLLGVGICGVYDPKTQTSYLTFKFKNEPTSTTITAKDFTIGFNHQINKFTGFYDMYPGIWHRHYQFVLSCNNPKNIQKYYGTGMASTDFVVGDVIADLNNEYICTTAGTVAAYATPPSGAIFTSINKTNQIWVQNEEVSYATPPPGYVYNKMYGRVVDNELIVIVNPKSGRPFSVDTIAQQDYNVNFTDIYYSNTNQTGADNSITGTNRDYQYVDGELWGSVPNANGSYGKSGRFTDLWLQVRMVKKNWVSATGPLVVSTSVKVLGYLKSLWRLKF